MAVAVLATLAAAVTANYALLIAAFVVGALIGLWLARRVQMTQMPELVALLHSFVGIAAVFVGFASFLEPATVLAGCRKSHSRR